MCSLSARTPLLFSGLWVLVRASMVILSGQRGDSLVTITTLMFYYRSLAHAAQTSPIFNFMLWSLSKNGNLHHGVCKLGNMRNPSIGSFVKSGHKIPLTVLRFSQYHENASSFFFIKPRQGEQNNGKIFFISALSSVHVVT